MLSLVCLTILEWHVCMVRDNSLRKMLHAWGWWRLKEACEHPWMAEDCKQVERYENECLNGGTDLDPHAFDVLGVHDRLRDAFPEFQPKVKSDDACEDLGEEH